MRALWHLGESGFDEPACDQPKEVGARLAKEKTSTEGALTKIQRSRAHA
jgi:hypothetical protein